MIVAVARELLRDAANRLTSIDDPTVNNADLTYDPLDRIATRTGRDRCPDIQVRRAERCLSGARSMIRFRLLALRSEHSTSPPPWDRLIGISASLLAVGSEGSEHLEENFPVVELCRDMCEWLNAHDMSIAGYEFVSVEADSVLLSFTANEDAVRVRFGHDEASTTFRTSEVAAARAARALIAATRARVRSDLSIDVDDLL